MILLLLLIIIIITIVILLFLQRYIVVRLEVPLGNEVLETLKKGGAVGEKAADVLNDLLRVGLVVAEGLQSFVKGLVHLSAAGALHRLVQLDGPLQLADLLHVERYNFDNVLSGGGAAVVHLLLLR